MAANIRSLVNGINPIVGASRDDLVVGDVVTLESVDVATTYSWSIAFKPQGSAATFSGVSVNPSPGTFTVDLEGPYLIRLVTDIGLPSESQQFVRLRYLTVFGSLTLVSAGEQNATGVPVPVDATASGWADQQNFNLQRVLWYAAKVSSSGRVFYVDPTPGYGDYTSIQDAIDAAVMAGASSSTPWAVLVRPGTYVEDLVFKPWVHVVATTPGNSNIASSSVLVRGTHVTALVGVNTVASIAGLHLETLTSTTSATLTHATTGVLAVDNCRVSMSVSSLTQGPAVKQESGTLYLTHSFLSFTSAGASSRLVLDVTGAAASSTFVGYSRLEGPSGVTLNSSVSANNVNASFMDTVVRATKAGGHALASDAVTLYLDYVNLSDTSGIGLLVHPSGAAFALGQTVHVRWSVITGAVSFNTTGIVGGTSLTMGSCEFSGFTFPGGTPTVFDALTLSSTVFYDNAVSGLSSANVQDAIDEIVGAVNGIPTTLDESYDGGIPASGSGRTIIADAGAVQIVDSALPSPIPPAGSTDGRLQVVGAVEVGAIGEPEISLEPNPFGTGAVVRMGWTVAPSNSPTAVGAPAILGRSTGTPLYRNYSLRVGTESTNGGGAVGNLFLAGGDGFDSGVTTPDGASVFLLAGSSFGGTGVAGNLYVAPGEGTTGNGQVVLAKPDTGTVASVTAAGVFVGGVTGDVTFALPTGSVTASILNTDNHAAVLVKLNALDGITAAGNPITVSSVAKGPAAFVYLLNTDPAGLDAALGVFQGQPMTAGAWTETVAVEASADNEITIGAGGALGPLIYNSDTGKLTVPGLIDPTGMVFSRAAAPATSASEGALFVSDGTGGLTAGSLYYRPGTNGVPINVSSGGGGGGGGSSLVSLSLVNTGATPYSVQSAQATSGLPYVMPLTSYVYFGNQDFVSPNWTLTGTPADTLTSNGLAGFAYSSAFPRLGRGEYYIEFECTAIAGTHTVIGLVGQSTLNASTMVGVDLGVGYDATGAVYVNGVAQPGTWGALADTDILGMYIQYINPDDPSLFGPGGFNTYAYFSINGTWQNGANPATQTAPVAFSTDWLQEWVYAASLNLTARATGTVEVVNYAALAAGDYITINGVPLAAEVSYRYPIVALSAPGLAGDQFNIYIGDPVTLYLSLVGVAGPRTPGSNDFDATTPGTIAALHTEIAAAINDPLNSFATHMTATVTTLGSTPMVVVQTIAPYTTARCLGGGVASGSYQSYPMDSFAIGSGPNYVTAQNMKNAINAATPPNSYVDLISASTVGATDGEIFLTSNLAGVAGNAITLTTSTANITVPATLSGGVLDPIVVVNPDVTVGLGESKWVAKEPQSNGTLYLGFPSPQGPPVYPADFNVTQTYPFPFNYLIGRSLVVRTTGDYDGGNISITFIRTDTMATETRTLIIVPGVDTLLEVPIQAILNVQNMGGPFNNGFVMFLSGDLWCPLGAPTSNVGGVNVPAPLTSVPPPMMFIQDVNSGSYAETLSIGGEDNNMVDVYSLTHAPTPSGAHVFVACDLHFVVTYAP